MALGGFFGAFANILGGLATSSMQRSDNEYLMNRQAELNKEQADYSTKNQVLSFGLIQKKAKDHEHTLHVTC